MVLANTALISYGLQCGWVAVSAKTLQSELSPTGTALSDNEISWLASAPSLAATVAVGIFASLVDKFGRKKCILLIAMFQAVSNDIFKIFNKNYLVIHIRNYID